MIKIRIKHIASLILTAVLLTSCNINSSDDSKPIVANVYQELDGEGLTEVFSSDDLSLEVDFDDLNICIKNLKNGKQWFTNPDNAQEDKIAVEDYKAFMKSQFELTYLYGRNVRTVNSYTECVLNNQYKVYKINNGVRIEYTLGDISLTINDIPKNLSKNRAKELILDNKSLSEEQKEFFNACYELDEKTSSYVWKSNNFGSRQNNIIALFTSIGYSSMDLQKDASMFGTKIEVEEKVKFVIPIEYTIENGLFKISAIINEIKYPVDYPVLKINICPLFGAQTNEKDGYIFLPDGSGVLLDFNKNDQSSISLNVYSNDISTGSVAPPSIIQPVLMPVFGLKSGDDAFLAIIEDGDAISMITAVRAERNSEYNAVGASFTVRAQDTMDLSAVSTVPADVTVLQQNMYRGRATIAYKVLNGKDASYAGMARTYREYLINSKGYKIKNEEVDSKIPLYIETIGAIQDKKSFLGFNYKSDFALTSLNETETILSILNQAGISEIYLKISGWFNKGTSQTIANKVRPIYSLGSTSQMNQLLKSGKTYLNVSFLNLESSTGVSLVSQGARKLDQQYVRTYLDETRNGYLLSTSYLKPLVEKFIKGMQKYKKYKISVSDLGNAAYADYNKKNEIDKQEALTIIEEEMKNISLDSGHIMTDTPNIHTALYADHALNTPLGGSKYYTANKEIPFYQLVFHGIMDYAGNPMNLSSTYQFDLLRAAEYGAGLYYKFSYKRITSTNDAFMKDSYSVCFNDWSARCINDYKELAELLSGLDSIQMTDHYFVSDTCTVTEYANGTKIAVNYGSDNVMVQQHNVKPKSFTKFN